MTQPLCEVCTRPLPDQAYVCSRCAEVVGQDLGRIVDLAGEVEDTIAKLTKMGGQLGGGSGERPLPFDPKAAERAAVIAGTLGTWVRHVCEERGIEVPPAVGDRGQVIASLASFLVEHLEWFRHRQGAAKAFGELRDAARGLERLVGRPRDHWYAGTCFEPLGQDDEAGDPLECQQELYAAKGARTIRCRMCGAEHDAEARKRWLLDQVRPQLLHAEWIARALTGWGFEKVTGSRIRNLADRGRLAAHGHDQADRPLYRVGEVLDLLEEQAETERQRAVARDAKVARKAAKEKVDAA